LTRNHRSARTAGARFERLIADHLAASLDDDRIDRRPSNGAKDRGDIGGVRTPHGGRLVIECKDTTRLDIAGWLRETELERGNDDAVAGLIVHKRHGVSDPGQQWVTCTVNDLIALLTGQRPQENPL